MSKSLHALKRLAFLSSSVVLLSTTSVCAMEKNDLKDEKGSHIPIAAPNQPAVPQAPFHPAALENPLATPDDEGGITFQLPPDYEDQNAEVVLSIEYGTGPMTNELLFTDTVKAVNGKAQFRKLNDDEIFSLAEKRRFHPIYFFIKGRNGYRTLTDTPRWTPARVNAIEFIGERTTPEFRQWWAFPGRFRTLNVSKSNDSSIDK